VLDLLVRGDPAASLIERVCEVSVRLLDVSGAGMCVVGGRQHQIVVHGTDRLAEELEDLQLSLGQGPCIAAVRSGSPVCVDDLADGSPAAWPRFAEQARSRGVRALFAFPLRVGDVQFGALDLYRLEPGGLDERQTADAHVLTDIANRAMLAQQDALHLDGSVSTLEWLTGETGSDARRGSAVDLGVTVGQARDAADPEAPTPQAGGPAGAGQGIDERR